MSSEIGKLKKSLSGIHAWSQDVERYRKAMESVSTDSEFRKAIELESLVRADMAKFARATDSANSASILEMSNKAWRDAVTGSLNGLSATARMTEQLKSLGSIQAALGSIDQSFYGVAAKLAEDLQSRHRLAGHDLSARDYLTGATSVVGLEIYKYCHAVTSTGSLKAMIDKYSPGLDEIAGRMAASFDFARLAANAALTEALGPNLSEVAKHYAKQFDGFAVRAQDVVGKMPTFDFATTAALAQFHGTEGLVKQLEALGLRPEDYLSVASASPTGTDEDIRHGLPEEWVGRRLSDLHQVIINLLATLIAAVFLAPYLPNPDIDDIKKRFDGVQLLVEQLPQVLAPLVDEAVRRELGVDRVSYVVRERSAKLRTEPVGGARTVAIAFPNQTLTLLENRGKWIKVEFYDYVAQDVTKGWVLKKYCQRTTVQRRAKSTIQ